jgi:Arc/MetJ-type ribon-helix-helix transcriptional regulator
MKVTVTLENKSMREVDRLVQEGRFPSRSRAVQAARAETMTHRKHSRLEESSGKLDPQAERALAKEMLSGGSAFVA